MSLYSEQEVLIEPDDTEEALPGGDRLTNQQEAKEIIELKKRVHVLETKLEEIANENHFKKL